MVDAARPERFEEAAKELHYLFDEATELAGIPVAVVAHKQDLDDAVSPESLALHLKLSCCGPVVKLACVAWLLVAKRLYCSRDVAVIIAKVVWASRYDVDQWAKVMKESKNHLSNRMEFTHGSHKVCVFFFFNLLLKTNQPTFHRS